MKRILTNALQIFLIAGLCVASSFVSRTEATFGDDTKPTDNKPSVKGDLYILSIGINQYQDDKLSDLKYAVADATDLANSLEGRAKGLFTNVHKKVLLDEQAKKGDIERVLDSLAKEIRSNDTLVFYFGGIGISKKSDTRHHAGTQVIYLFEPEKDVYLLPSDTSKNDLENTAIAGKQLRSYLRRLLSKDLLIIIDACDSAFGFESLVSKISDKDPTVTNLLNTNVIFIGTDAEAIEASELGHGLLTYAALKGLTGGADSNNDGVVTSLELESFLYCYIGKFSKKYPQFRPKTFSRGVDFSVGFTDKKVEEIVKEKEKSKDTNEGSEISRSEPLITKKDVEAAQRKGNDYALLIAIEDYRNWRKLNNPVFDAEEISKKLIKDYGFKPENVRLEKNLERQQIMKIIAEYQQKEFKEDDQLFVFFAGHGTVQDVSKTLKEQFLVAKDSPKNLTEETQNSFIQMYRFLALINDIDCKHIFVVLDACYVGGIWDLKLSAVPQIADSNVSDKTNSDAGLNHAVNPQINKDAYIKRKMSNLTRMVLTAGNEPVSDGAKGKHSPFARGFLRALDKGGVKFGVLTTGEIYSELGDLDPEPKRGILNGGFGDFVFISVKKDK